MRIKSKLVYKLSIVVAVIMIAAIALSGYVNNHICAHYSEESAEAFLKFNSESMVQGIGELMMTDNKEGIQRFIAEISQDSEVYGEIRYVDHHSDTGKVAASRFGGERADVGLQDRACSACHDLEDPSLAGTEMMAMAIDRPQGERVLSVVAPILNEPRCSSASCHVHAEDPPILGILSADYSLSRLDSMAWARRIFIIVTVFTSLALGMVALWLMFTRLLEKPIAELIAGTRRIAAHELDFRFDQKRDDEIGALEESFNIMTARIQAHRDELREAMEYLGGIVENSADMIITVTPDGFIETFNRGAEQALGYSRVEVIGQPVEMLFANPRDRNVAISRLADTDNVKNFETRFLGKDGQVRNVLLTLSRLRDRDNNPIGTFGISKDITQDKELQDELRDAKQYLEGMFENSADIIITVNPEGLIETLNRGGEEALGYGREELIGRRIESLYVDPRERHAIARLLEETGNVQNYETRLLAKDGQARSVLLTLSPLRDTEGNPIGTIGISKDVTQEKILQRELVQSQKLAAIGQAVTGIQHAIKNMLNALTGGAYLVRNGMSKDNQQQIKEGWGMVEEGIERIGSLSRNMLNYAKDWKLDLQRVDLDELVADICELNRQVAADRGIALCHETCDGLPAVLCDPSLVHMAVTDIVVNAIDACDSKEYGPDENAEVKVKNSLTEGGIFAEIEVRDNGPGMNEETKRNIFTPFFSTKKTQGTGLGLAVTAKIIKTHEGEIYVDSEPDSGTAFRIYIPKDGPRDQQEREGE